MTDILDAETEVAEEVTEQSEEEIETTEPTEEQVAAYLEKQGIDFKKAKNMAAWEKDTNTKASDLGRIAKELEHSRESATPKEAVAELDPETQKELKAALKAVGLDVDSISAVLSMAKQSVDEGREEAFESFIAAHTDVEPSELVGELVESGIDPKALTPAQLRRELAKAHKVIVAGKLDPEAIAKAAVDKYLADQAAKGIKPEDIVEVKKGRGSASGAHRSVDALIADPNVSFFDKMDALQ